MKLSLIRCAFALLASFFLLAGLKNNLLWIPAGICALVVLILCPALLFSVKLLSPANIVVISIL